MLSWKNERFVLMDFIKINIVDTWTKLTLADADLCFVFYVVLALYFSDVDECSSNNGGCHEHATCDNTEGSFTCTCQPGYSGDGLHCVGGFACVKK